MEKARIHGTSMKRIWQRSLKPNEKKKHPYDGERVTLESLDDKSLKDFLSSFTQDPRIHELKVTLELSLFFSRCHDVTFIGQEMLFKNVQKHFHHLPSLTMRFWCSRGTTDKSLEAIGDGVGRSLPNLKRFKLILIECHSITDKGVNVLGQKLSQKLKGLETLEISFRHCRELTGESLSKLGSNISRNLMKLESLALTFVLVKTLNEKHIEELMSSFDGKLANLRHINLDFGPSRWVTDEGFSILGKKIAENFQALENLELVLAGFINLTDEGIERMLGPIGFGLTRLKKLRFSLEGCPNVTNKSLERIGKEIGSNFLNLKTLQLNLRSLTGGVNGEGFEALNKQLFEDLNNLESLVFRTSSFEDINLESLLANLRTLKELKRVNLDFSYNEKISRHSISNFLIQMKSELMALEDLSVNFSGLNREASKDFSVLQFEENNIFNPNLKSLSLSLKFCKDLSLQEAENLCVNYIGHFLNLEHLQLEFDGTEPATTALLDKVREMLVHLKKLKSLSFYFQFCKISIEEAQKLILAISEVLPELKTLKLAFSGMYLQNYSPQLAFVDQLQKFNCLEDYNINFI